MENNLRPCLCPDTRDISLKRIHARDKTHFLSNRIIQMKFAEKVGNSKVRFSEYVSRWSAGFAGTAKRNPESFQIQRKVSTGVRETRLYVKECITFDTRTPHTKRMYVLKT